MKQTVLNTFFNQNLPATAGSGKPFAKAFALALVTLLLAFNGKAQTYNTIAAGNWSSASTWEGGVVPSITISSSRTVNIKHSVVFNYSSDLNINGTLNITGDSLRFASSYDKKITVASTGRLSVKNGGFLQVVSSNKSEMLISGGRITLENALMLISKNVKALAGTKRTYKHSTLIVGEKYETEGTSGNRSIDTVWNSHMEAGRNSSGFEYKDYSILRVANATMIASKGSFIVKAASEVKVLPGAAGNFGFDFLKTQDDLENEAPWDARIDAHCVGKDIKGSRSSEIDITGSEDCNPTMQTGELPEMAFGNPVLKSGTANRPGAVYRFANVTSGVDAEIILKKFSRTDIVMQDVDLSGMGWEKAFQPQFGLAGLVAPYQNWYIDFELNFYKAGTNVRQRLSKVVFTALDVDGDGWSIGEYATFANPSSTEYSPVSFLGNGEVDILDPIADAGDLNTIVGTVQNFHNIDTAATQVMATFSYLNKDKITFRYGARSGANSSNGSGIRLNSMWAKPFSLDPWISLPVKFSSFNLLHDKGDASLTWTAEQSDKLNNFVVQRSTDGKTFTNIATVLTSNGTAYSYKDKSIASATGIVYYRVMAMDKTAEAQYSVVKSIRLNQTESAVVALSTYPNPVATDVRVTFPNAWQGKAVTVQLYTANGTLAKNVQIGSASQTESFNLTGLAKGMYVVKATCGTEAAQQRIVKN